MLARQFPSLVALMSDILLCVLIMYDASRRHLETTIEIQPLDERFLIRYIIWSTVQDKYTNSLQCKDAIYNAKITKHELSQHQSGI